MSGCAVADIKGKRLSLMHTLSFALSNDLSTIALHEAFHIRRLTQEVKY